MIGDIELRQELKSYQILFIVLSALIGTGIFVTNTDALQLTGPDGLLVSLIVLGVIAVSVGDTVGHLVQLFPAPNAVFEYIYNFVDRELAWVIGFVYWYTWIAVFASEFLQAATMAKYWGPASNLIYVMFYVMAPLVFVVLNCFNVKYFGWVETAGGVLKVSLLIGVSIALFVVAGEDGEGGSDGPINDDFQTNTEYAGTSGTAFGLALPLVAYSFGGIESTTMAAFEARSVKDIAWASSSIHWITSSLYLVLSIAIMLTVPWQDTSLPSIYSQATSNTASTDNGCGGSTIAVVVALCNTTKGNTHGHTSLAGFVNGCLLYSVLSAANTALYMASRTLYGLTSSSRIRERGYLARFIQGLGSTHPRTGVPVYALAFSWLICCWVPLLGFHDNPGWVALDGIKQFLFVTSSMAYLVVWAVLCLAFIRFRNWTNKCAKGLERLDEQSRPRNHTNTLSGDDEDLDHYQNFVSLGRATSYRKHVNYILPQPLAAWIGVAGCFMLFIVSSSVWWDSRTNVPTAWSVSVYFVEGIVLILWLILKAWNMTLKTGWIKMNDDPLNPSELKDCLDNLVRASEKGDRRSEAHRVAMFANNAAANSQN